MKSVMKIAAAIILSALACTTAFAASKQTVEFTTFKNVTIGSTQLKPGEYKVAVETNGADAKLTFLQNKKTVATAEGKYTEAKLGFGFAVITEGPAVKQLQGDKLNGTIELK